MMRRVTIVTARTWVHTCYKHEGARVINGVFGSADVDVAIFQRLTQNFQGGFVELWQFVTEEHAIMGKRYFAGLWRGSSTYQCYLRDGMVRRSERALGNEGYVLG